MLQAAVLLAAATLGAVLASACGDAGSPGTAPSPPPSQQVLVFTLTGVVTELTAQSRTALANTEVAVIGPLAVGRRYHAVVRTDAQGRYVATGIPPGTSVTVVYVDNNTDYCVQPAAAIVVVDRETTADVEVVCGPVTPARHSPALFGFLRDSRQPRPSLRWLYFDAACDGFFEAGAIIDLDSSYQLSRLPLGRACLHSHGKTVEVDVRGDTRFDVDVGSLP
jgi:hypothetical protein